MNERLNSAVPGGKKYMKKKKTHERPSLEIKSVGGGGEGRCHPSTTPLVRQTLVSSLHHQIFTRNVIVKFYFFGNSFNLEVSGEKRSVNGEKKLSKNSKKLKTRFESQLQM